MVCKWLHSRVTQSTQTLDETAAKEFIQQLLGKKYSDMVSEVSKLSEDTKSLLKYIK